MHNLSIYLHWPWCLSKCPYCDFNSAARTPDEDAWAAACLAEIRHYARLMPERRITSIYFGGGTPSLMRPRTVEALLREISAHWQMSDDVEITLEANPTSSESDKFAGFRAAGVGRLSLGVQALDDEALRFLGRTHNADEARKAIELAARHFPRFTFDLIYARAGQTAAAWAKELGEALAFGAKHMSLYQLTIEQGTRFATRALMGDILQADEEDAAAMYEATQEIMRKAGLPAYEISNHAAAGEASRHNLTYWRYEDYLGIGPGAHGRFVAEGQRWATENHAAPEAWQQQVAETGHGCCAKERLDRKAAQREALLMGLRLVEGISLAKWQEKFGETLSDFLSSQKVARMQDEGLLFVDSASVRATSAGLQRLNAVLGYLVE